MVIIYYLWKSQHFPFDPFCTSADRFEQKSDKSADKYIDILHHTGEDRNEIVDHLFAVYW